MNIDVSHNKLFPMRKKNKPMRKNNMALRKKNMALINKCIAMCTNNLSILDEQLYNYSSWRDYLESN